MWCAIVASEICSESSDCSGSATVAGTVRDHNSILVRWTLDFEMDSQCAVLEPGLSDPNQLKAEKFHVNSLEAP